MSTMMRHEVSRNTVGVCSPTLRIVPEPDPDRAKKQQFSPIRQTIFWLRTGQNANEKDMTQARDPFTTLLSSDGEQTTFENGLQTALTLYGDRFIRRTSDDNSIMVVGEYSHQLQGTPAVVIGRSQEGLRVSHTWIPDTIRDSRL